MTPETTETTEMSEMSEMSETTETTETTMLPILTPEEAEAMKEKVAEAYTAMIHADWDYDNLLREMRDAVDEKVRAYRDKVSMEITEKYKDLRAAAYAKRTETLDAHSMLALEFGARRPADPKERVLPIPGTKVVEWCKDYRRYYSDKDEPPLQRTGRVGVVELATPETEYAENIGSWAMPRVGERFVRLLKKDGKPGKVIERKAENWFEAGVDPRVADGGQSQS